jgi:hypothetical protein
MRRAVALLTAVIVTCFAMVPAAGAKSAAMLLPAELAQLQPSPVSGRQGWKLNEKLAFASTRVFDVDRSLSRGNDLGILFYQGSKRRQTFGFSMVDGSGEVWRGAAATNVHRRALSDGNGLSISLTDKSGFAAHLAPLDRPQELWVMELTEQGEQPLKGSLRHNDVVYAVTGTNKLAGTKLPLEGTSGYVVARGGEALAAVEVINNGAVWVAPHLSAEQRQPLLAAVSALLLFEDLRATLPD